MLRIKNVYREEKKIPHLFIYKAKKKCLDAPDPFSRIKIAKSRTSSDFRICLSKRHIKIVPIE